MGELQALMFCTRMLFKDSCHQSGSSRKRNMCEHVLHMQSQNAMHVHCSMSLTDRQRSLTAGTMFIHHRTQLTYTSLYVLCFICLQADKDSQHIPCIHIVITDMRTSGAAQMWSIGTAHVIRPRPHTFFSIINGNFQSGHIQSVRPILYI